MKFNNHHIFCTDRSEGGMRCFIRFNDLEIETLSDHVFRIAIYRSVKAHNTLNTDSYYIPLKAAYKEKNKLILSSSSQHINPSWLIFNFNPIGTPNTMSIANWRIK
jgi:hypothetical protein